jgi:Spy/CpxP family protein refolding chaperone
MSTPTVSSMEADAVMDRAMGHGCATSGGRGTKKIQLTPYQRKQLEKTKKENTEKEMQQKKSNTAIYLTLKQQSEAGLLAEF